LYHADPLWIARLQLASAAGVLACGLGLFSLLWGVLRAATVWTVPMLNSAAFYAGGQVLLLNWLGSWLLSTPDPEERVTRAARVRAALRICATMYFLGLVCGVPRTLFDYGLAVYGESMRWVVFVISAALAVATYVLYYLHLRNLGLLIPDRFIARHAPLVLGAHLLSAALLALTPLAVQRETMAGAVTVTSLAMGLAGVYSLVLHLRAYRTFHDVASAARDQWPGRATGGSSAAPSPGSAEPGSPEVPAEDPKDF
jgi:hypothetical protein